jgi:hypothetical protein
MTAPAKTSVKVPDVTFLPLSFGDIEVDVEYDYDAGQRGQTSGPPERCWEEIPPSVAIISVRINGTWIEAEGNFAPEVIARWEQSVCDAIEDQTRDDWADRQAEESL